MPRSCIALLSITCLLGNATAADSCTPDLCTFTLEFGEDLTTRKALQITGQYPNNGATSFHGPIVYFRGTYVPPIAYADITSLAKYAGTVVATMQYSNYDGSDFATWTSLPDASELCDNFYGLKAAQLFGDGPATGLSVLCAHPKIDCSKGVGIGGYSQGADISIRAAKLDARVKAYFGLAATTAYFSDVTTKAVLTGESNLTSPPFDMIDCEIQANNPLPSSSLRFLVGGIDDSWNFGKAFGGPAASDETARFFQVLNHKRLSGYSDCAQTANCLKSDGSGYLILEGKGHEGLLDQANIQLGKVSHFADGLTWLFETVGSGSTCATAPEVNCTAAPATTSTAYAVHFSTVLAGLPVAIALHTILV